jgi:hypothetical protein
LLQELVLSFQPSGAPCFGSPEEHVRTSPPGWYSSPALEIRPIETFQAENLSYFLAITSENGLFSSKYRPYIDATLARTDFTFFLPNSAEALASVNATGLKATIWLGLAAYGMFPQTIHTTDFINGTQIDGIYWVSGICHCSRRGYMYQHGEDHIEG